LYSAQKNCVLQLPHEWERYEQDLIQKDLKMQGERCATRVSSEHDTRVRRNGQRQQVYDSRW
jgi:hypothetical protein